MWRWSVPILLIGLCACRFHPPPPAPPGIVTWPLNPDFADFSTIVDSAVETVYEEENKIGVYKGFACAKTEEDGRHGFFLYVEQSQKLPKAFTEATVYLTGWRFRYLNGEHGVAGLGTAIMNIRGQFAEDRENDELKWEAVGAISDDNWDDPFHWCYHYIVVGWNRSQLDVFADHRDSYHFVYGQGDWATALQYGSSTIQVKQYRPSATILPRGFGFRYDGGDDHAFLQLAYNLDTNVRFTAIQRDPITRVPVPPGFDHVVGFNYSWETKTIFKDNATQRDYDAGEVVSVISGPDMGVVQPPFTIVPFEDHGNCVAFGDVETEDRTITNIPFDLGIPVLTGWDLSFYCDDNNIQDIGIWIDTFEWHPAGVTTGFLTYTMHTVLSGHDRRYAPRFRYRVGVLGIGPQPVTY